MRGLLIAVAFLIVMNGVAWSQIPTSGNVFFGYSYARTPIVTHDSTNLNGWDGSLEGNFLPWIGLVADIDAHYGSETFNGINANLATHNALFGPRVSVSVKRFRPFAEFLVGVSHVSRNRGYSDASTSFADAVGGGLDYRVFGPFTVRGQLDWISTRFFGNTQNGARFSTGIALHF